MTVRCFNSYLIFLKNETKKKKKTKKLKQDQTHEMVNRTLIQYDNTHHANILSKPLFPATKD